MYIETIPRRLGGLASHLLHTGRGSNERVIVRSDLSRDMPADVELGLRLLATPARRIRRMKRDVVHVVMSPERPLTQGEVELMLGLYEAEYGIPASNARIVVEHHKGKRASHFHIVYPQLVLVLYILTLFQFIRRHAVSARSYELGHGILQRDCRYASMVGAPRDLQKTYNVWKALRPGANGPWCKPLHDGLVELSIVWRAKHGVDAPKTPYDHGVELVEAAFKALLLANELRSNVRKVHAFNFRGSNGDDWRAILELAVDGIVYKATRGDYEVYWPNRALLALHGRFNPAKIWRDTTRDTLLYEWLIAIGDFARTGRMVVTCHMAQALFIADDIRSEPGQVNAISPEWDLFDQALEKIAGDKARYISLRRDLILHCAQAMRGKCAIVLTVRKGRTAGFSAKELSRQESIIADTLILYS